MLLTGSQWILLWPAGVLDVCGSVLTVGGGVSVRVLHVVRSGATPPQESLTRGKPGVCMLPWPHGVHPVLDLSGSATTQHSAAAECGKRASLNRVLTSLGHQQSSPVALDEQSLIHMSVVTPDSVIVVLVGFHGMFNCQALGTPIPAAA